MSPARTHPKAANGNTQAIERQQEQSVNTISKRFLGDVERQFAAELGGGPKFTEFERRLTQHMYLKVDAALKLAETKRSKGTEFSWHTIDRQKLALDTVHRVSLGLDALIQNHIHPVFYWNSHKEAYDVDLQVGYVGRDYIARRFAVEPPVDITYELVYDTDHFRALPRSATREVEAYDFEIEQPFDRGTIVGGFGYIVYDDPRKNRLVLVTQRDFKRSKAASKSNFWANNEVEMHFKTVVHRVASKIPLDAEKVNAAAFAAVTADDDAPDETVQFEQEVATHANRQLVDTAPVEDRTIDAEPAPQADPDLANENGNVEAQEPEKVEETRPAPRQDAEQGSLADEAGF